MASVEGETSNEDGGGGSIEDLYQINVFPSELFLKFRKELQGFRVGVNLEVGIGHNFHHNLTGWKWKISTCLGGDGISQFRNKSSVSLFPGFDLRIGYRAEYILPDIHGAVGTGEPIFNMNYGKLHASIDRFEAIITHGS
ncbi:hypothetical protein IHE45_18G009400 [Dioscorea alata]|uniref:Uncharacterized protein n=1 Tax=Dioscorea alata TaxID=55571 RepID=A0ACB7U579_DIOAL|nr:hypothetical protein IHE45_18G009400 [Dioscorea alata]